MQFQTAKEQVCKIFSVSCRTEEGHAHRSTTIVAHACMLTRWILERSSNPTSSGARRTSKRIPFADASIRRGYLAGAGAGRLAKIARR
jgi:hypothetical protein